MSAQTPTEVIRLPVTPEGLELPPGTIVLEREIPSHTAFVAPLIQRVLEVAVREGLALQEAASKLQLCLVEALRNAIAHGNRNDFTRKVTLKVYVDRDEWGIVVEDQGGGFDPVIAGSGDHEVWGESGRGLRILRHYSDRMEYYRGGRTLFLRMKRERGS